ncbi:MAG TPA: SBBP repeat-containing protein [Bryobacteraceae bacterium]|nr:SBBP repeat-containing protein [Bryobacteraceae bacterium]
MQYRNSLILVLAFASQTFAQISFRPAFTQIFGGSGTEGISAVAVDQAGNIIVAGTTTSFDFPTVNAFQSVNNGVPLVFSPDAGITWKPLADQSPVGATAIAVDPTDPNTIYIGGSDRVYKSTDGGAHFTFADLPLAQYPFGTVRSSVTELAIDPRNPKVIYSARPQNGVTKSTDGGLTWTLANAGLNPNLLTYAIRVDPFHPGTLIVWESGQPYRSTDGAQTWAQIPAPGGCCFYGTGIGVAFDPFTPGVVYGNSPQQEIYKSTDNGQSWTPLHVPFQGIIRFITDPSTKDTLYASVEAASDNSSNGVWKTTDGGVTWTRLGLQQQMPIGLLSIDPANPKVLLSSQFRSEDAGVTWRPTALSRSATSTFARDGRVYAIAETTSDAFVRKYDPSGSTVIFSTYLGGQGAETASGVAVDAAGNIYVTGSTSSLDFPVTSGAFQTQLQGARDAFVAKLAPDGSLAYATYLGGSFNDDATGIAVDSSGSAIVAGTTASGDFPGSANPQPSFLSRAFVARLSPDGGSLVYGTPIGVQSSGPFAVAIDPQGNAVVTGQGALAGFPITNTLFPGNALDPGVLNIFIFKVSPTGVVFYSTYFGGSKPASNDEPANSFASGVAVDATGNIYVSGYTNAKDFPVTSGALQPSLSASCPYPSATISTFFFTVFRHYMDDFFVTKISADGNTPLFSTFLGGNCYDTSSSLALDPSGNVWIAGNSDSSPFPELFPVESPPIYSDYKGVVSGISADGSSLLFSSYTSAGSHPVLATGADSSLVIAGSAASGPPTGFAPVLHAYVTKLVPAALPSLSLNAVMNGFSFQPGPIAPGEIVALSIPNYNPGSFTDLGLIPQQSLDTQLAGTQVLFDGQPAYIMLVQPGQVICFAPSSLDGKTSTQVQVEFKGQLSNALTVPVSATALGLLSADNSGAGLANARNEDGTPNSATNPAAPGSLITLYFTGAGITNPPEPDGMVVGDPNVQPVANITLGGIPVEFIGPLPGFVPGIFQIMARVPLQPAGANPLRIAVSSKSSSSQVLYFYVKPN